MAYDGISGRVLTNFAANRGVTARSPGAAGVADLVGSVETNASDAGAFERRETRPTARGVHVPHPTDRDLYTVSLES